MAISNPALKDGAMQLPIRIIAKYLDITSSK